ncbi:SusC/RagA family TonB-linked outer membrane protein [Sphingobacterium sp. LRF_L2]|uniref:SusC/RagA family TonB-linked outer membrane protein n=1 Tax=Sphingobacterium sp. LRF_L2 TaxID=3369421 RepID=UPI003F5E44AD
MIVRDEQKRRKHPKVLLCFVYVFVCLALPAFAFAQQIVKGTVRNSNGEGLPNVNVMEKGSNNGIKTDESGKFELRLKSNNATLVFSSIGMKTIEQPVTATSGPVEVNLLEDLAGLDEVVVIGYGTQRKGDVTSAIVSVKAEDFLAGNVRDAADLIRSKVAGLNITKGSGDPNAESRVVLRGLATLEGNSSPLVLVDGIVGTLSTVPPESIESIDVLKDASAAAIYGTRGANGVILITTKKGSQGERATVNYNAYAATSQFYKIPEFMDAQDIRDGYTNFTDLGHNTDWLDAVMQTGFTQNHSLNIQGGSKNTSYSANVTYRDENGVMKQTDLSSIKTTFDLTHSMWDNILKLNFNLVQSEQRNNVNAASAADLSSPYRQAVIHNPTAPIYNEDGSYYEDYNVYQYYNPVAILNERQGDNKTKRSRLTGNITLEPIKGWTTNLIISRQNTTGLYGYYSTKQYYTSRVNAYNGSAYRSDSDTRSDNLELTTNYRKVIGDHNFSVLGGYSYLYNETESGSMFNYDFPTDVYSYHNISLGNALKDGDGSMTSNKVNDRLIGFFGRLSYTFKDRYNLLASFRREGSSKFGDNNKWGNFPAVSLGWTLTKERFLENAKWLNNLKLRGGYGVTGVIPGESYLSLTRYNYGNFYYEDGEWQSGLAITSNPNPDLRWEKSAELNIGVDFSLFNDRFGGSVDFYNKNTKDMLWDYNVPLPPNLYSVTKANVGKMNNKGVEVMLNFIPVRKEDFEWKTMLTASHNKNKLISLSNDLYQTTNFLEAAYAGDPISVPTHRLEEGQPFGNYWGPKSVGVTEAGIWIIEDPKTGEAVEFSPTMLTDDYRQYLGNGMPKLFLGWNNSFRYKKFDFNMQLSSQWGFQILNEQRMFYENNSIAYNRLKTAKDAVYGIAPLSSSQSQTFMSYYLENGNFVKLNNINVGYSFKLNQQKYIQHIRVYLTGQNLFSITNYSGLDPELTNSNLMGAGTDPRDKYPSIRSFTFGLNLTL